MMFARWLFSFLVCVPLYVSGMELEVHESWPYMPEDVQWEVVKATKDFQTIRNFSAVSKYHNEKYDMATCVLKSTDLCESLTPNQHRFLLVHFAQQNNSLMCELITKHENQVCAYWRMRAHNAFTIYYKSPLNNNIDDFMVI